MRTVTFPSTNESELYDRLCAHRLTFDAVGAALLDASRQDVMDAYDEYTAGDMWRLVSALPADPVAVPLKANYVTLRSGALKEVGAELLSRSSLCCLCALRDTSELDHYLPKEDFPEFAALSLNLVPACSVCNGKKARNYRDTAGGQLFVHAYFDDLPDSLLFLKSTLSTSPTVVPSFHVSQPAGMSTALFGVIENQFKLFGLDAAYSDAAIELLLERRRSIEEYYVDGGAPEVAKYLDRDARSAADHVGANHWKPVFLAAAAASVDFCSGGFKNVF